MYAWERVGGAVHALTEVLEPWDGELRLTNSRYTGSTSPCLTVVHTSQQQVHTDARKLHSRHHCLVERWSHLRTPDAAGIENAAATALALTPGHAAVGTQLTNLVMDSA